MLGSDLVANKMGVPYFWTRPSITTQREDAKQTAKASFICDVACDLFLVLTFGGTAHSCVLSYDIKTILGILTLCAKTASLSHYLLILCFENSLFLTTSSNRSVIDKESTFWCVAQTGLKTLVYAALYYTLACPKIFSSESL